MSSSLTRQQSMGQALSGIMRTSLQQPMSRAMAAVSEGSMAALQAPVTLAMAGARMGSGVIMVRALCLLTPAGCVPCCGSIVRPSHVHSHVHMWHQVHEVQAANAVSAGMGRATLLAG